MSHIHKHFHRKAGNMQDDVEINEIVERDPAPVAVASDGPVYSIIFVTASQTFTGSIAGYSTDFPAAVTTATTPTAGFDFATVSSQDTFTSTSGDPSTSETTSTPTSIAAATSSTESSISQNTSGAAAATSTAATSANSSTNTNTNTAISAATSSSSLEASESGSGLSEIAKAGLAIGVVVFFAAAAAILLLVLCKKKKNSASRRAQNEKSSFAPAPAAPMAARTEPSPAPRLSLRPVSKLLPDLMGVAKTQLSQRSSQNTYNQPSDATGAGFKLTPTSRAASPWERRGPGSSAAATNPFQDPHNPFGDAAKAAGAGAALGASLAASNPNHASGAPGTVSPDSAARGDGDRNETPPPSNVYRVLIDFIPTLEDELELRAGQLVRLIKEYDDGWALCVKLDRSQQGAAPRSCLAEKPSIPRNQPSGPAGPGPANPRPLRTDQTGRMSPVMSRPSSAVGDESHRLSQRDRNSTQGNSRSGTPTGNNRFSQQRRPGSPGPGSFNMAPRPLSPGPRSQTKRSMSPGPYGQGLGGKPVMPSGRRRSHSASAVRERRESPPGPSKLGPGGSPTVSRSQAPGHEFDI